MRTTGLRSTKWLPAAFTAVGAAALLVLAGCGGDAAATAEGLIEGQLADEIELGELTAACNQPDELEQGETFECTAITTSGDVIEFVGEMTSDDDLNVQTTNLLTESDVQSLLPPIADAVSREVGDDVVADDLTCPTGTVILDDNGDFMCTILDRSTGDVYTIAIETGGLEAGGGPKDLGFQIGDLVDP